MSRRPILVLFHEDDSPPGLLGEWLDARALTWELGTPGVPPADPSPYRAIVSLGSTSSANGPEPWIGAELALLEAAIDAEIPVLGLCFGSQLLARAAGGTVSVSPPGEFGWVRPAREGDAAGEPGPITALPWFCWHDDTFTVPPGAEPLAATDFCPQAYTLGPHLGLQFHPEVDEPTIERWLDHRARPEHPPLDLRPTIEENVGLLPGLRERAFSLFDWWLARTEEPEPAEVRPS